MAGGSDLSPARNDAHFDPDHPWAHGHLPGGFGREHRFWLAGGGALLVWWL